MSAGDNYYTAPLSILRSGKSHLEALESALACGIVNAGIGYEKHHGEEAFKELLKEASKEAGEQRLPTKPPKDLALKYADGSAVPPFEADQQWKYAHAGFKLLRIIGGRRDVDAQHWLNNHRTGGVFFKLRSDWMWGAVYQARREDGKDVQATEAPISWREFRILAAILSAGCNRHGFVYLGWESIQARACGFHSKELFENGKASLPEHCQPFTRDQIMRTCERLEGLRFFLRLRDSKGPRGGLMAYSFRHETRELLADAIAKKKAENSSLEAQVKQNREADMALSRRNPQVTHNLPASGAAT